MTQRRVGCEGARDGQDRHFVIDVPSKAQDVLTCREIDLLWQVAEAFSGIGDAPRARDVYRYILAQCDNPNEGLATAQNATLTLPAAIIHERIAIGRRGGASGEFDPVLPDLFRRDVGRPRAAISARCRASAR